MCYGIEAPQPQPQLFLGLIILQIFEAPDSDAFEVKILLKRPRHQASVDRQDRSIQNHVENQY